MKAFVTLLTALVMAVMALSMGYLAKWFFFWWFPETEFAIHSSEEEELGTL
jgi:hypothetical protein